MISFEKTHFSFETKEKASLKLVYKADQEITGVLSVETSCGCTKANIINDTVVVNFTAPTIPKHLSYQGYYNSSKKITIKYTNNTAQVLSFTAKITK